MIDLREAAMSAAGYFADLYADQKYSDILLDISLAILCGTG